MAMVALYQRGEGGQESKGARERGRAGERESSRSHRQDGRVAVLAHINLRVVRLPAAAVQRSANLLRQACGVTTSQPRNHPADVHVRPPSVSLCSCGCPPLEKVWEADLEACHLFLRGLQLRTPSYGGADSEEPPCPAPAAAAAAAPCRPAGPMSSYPPTARSTTEEEEEEEEDCAMLTALGGRWCPEANLQHSEFTKKLEEFLFCMEDVHTEDECGAGGAGGEVGGEVGGEEEEEITEQCEAIRDRLLTLEDDMQMAVSLEKEVREVKATLQAMLVQLQEGEEEQRRHRTTAHDCDLMENGIEKEEEEEEEEVQEEEEEEEEEDQYFSDSWDI
ncbi:hypothetical protein CRUP_020931 [Coryphaenoides rupestris]|nr:hypothetical protein CRUP_020931 [Coryphaenoides rupestris]